MIVLVLGMHKSGTSLLAEILHRSGIAMGDLAEGGADYDAGHKFEDGQVQAINKALLGFGESYRLAGPSDLRLGADTLAAMRDLVAERLASGADWGFKDPRTVLCYPAWKPLLPPHRLVLIFRRPAEVWGHYRRLGPRGPFHRRVRWAWAILSAWVGYNRRLLAIAAAAPAQDRLILDYAALMDPDLDGFRRLAAFIGRPLADARQPGRYRNRARHDPVVLTYDLLTAGRITRTWRALREAETGGGKRGGLGGEHGESGDLARRGF